VTTLSIWMYNSGDVIHVNNEEDIKYFYQCVQAESKFAVLSNVIINLRYVERVYIREDEE
jgi:hypothetical protein